MHRRRFLRTRPVAAAVLPTPPPPATASDYTLIRVSRRAMATTFEIALPFGFPDAIAAAEEALDLIDELEDQLTVYRDHSEVSRLNATAAESAIPVEERLFELLSDAASLTRDTEGAFDIATGSLIKAWGFYRREGRLPSSAERVEAMGRTGMRHVILDAGAKSVKYRRAGLELNLGAIGKGYALDRAAELLRVKWGVSSALLHGGGSSVLAVGTPPGQPRGWPVAIQHPSDERRNLGTVWLTNQALGTSAATFQFFEYNGKKYGHLLDPRTGYPAEGVASASAVANTAATADALSTAFFVLGQTATANYCQSRPGLAAVMLAENEPPRTVGLSADRYDLPGLRTLADLSLLWD